MRRIDADRPRPYRVPGADAVAATISISCAAILGIALMLFIYVPGDGMQWRVFLGAATVLAIGEITIRVTEKVRHADELAAAPTPSP